MNDAESRRCLEPFFLFFDDEPIEHILYGEGSEGGRPANLFGPAIACAETMGHLAEQKDVNGLMEVAFELGQKRYPLTKQVCFKLIHLTAILVPNIPLAVLPFDLSSLGPLFEHLWEYIIDTGDNYLSSALGGRYYRWHEHYGDYERARSVLAKLIEIAVKEGNASDEAVYTNNFAFEFLLERRWDEAIPLFERAASLFEKSGNARRGWANSKANSWLCRFGTGDFGNEEETKQELVEILHLVNADDGYIKRKPLILLARLAEHQGNVRKAIRLARRGIERGSDGMTKFPEIDALYLKDLENKVSSVT